jgi:dolichyl-phosphate mannosyltransferase polypeptide 3
MKRAGRVFSTLIASTLVWLTLLFELVPLSLIAPGHTAAIREILPFAPLIALCVFGCYSLGSIGYSLVTFNDCPDAYVELQGQIKQAHADLSKKGMKF